MYTSTRPTEAALRDFYTTNAYYSKTTYANPSISKERLDQIARPKFDFLIQFCASLKPDSWLDIGCGVGDLLYVAQQNNFRNVVGLELSNSSREFSKEHYGLDLISSTIHDYASSNEQNNFDVISLIGLLEHVTDPDSTLKSAISLSHPETFFLIQVPNWDSLATKLQCFFPNNVYRHASPLEHIQLFTEQSINTLLANNGLEINSIWCMALISISY